MVNIKQSLGLNNEKSFNILKNFSDIYIDSNEINKSYFTRISSQKLYFPKQENEIIFIKEILSLIQEKRKKNKNKDFGIKYKNFLLRVFVIPSVNGEIFACRKMNTKVLELNELGFPEKIKNILTLNKLSEGGLVLICGNVGSGKTTTASSMIAERLKKYGGLCLTAEDPPESEINGFYSNGHCIQTEIIPELGYAPRVRELLRAYPVAKNNILFIGEMRDADTAEQALRASLDGRLVITTMHTKNLESALSRIHSYASTSMGSKQSATILSDSFRLALFQELTSIGVRAEYLLGTNIVRNLIKNNKYEQLSTHIEQQKIIDINSNIFDI